MHYKNGTPSVNKKQSQSASFYSVGNFLMHCRSENHLFSPPIKPPFSYSKLGMGVSLCLLMQLGLSHTAYGADSQNSGASNSNSNPVSSPAQSATIASTNPSTISNSIDQDRPHDSEHSTEDLEEALVALRLKQAVEQGLIDPSTLEDYRRETLGNDTKSDTSSNNLSNAPLHDQNQSDVLQDSVDRKDESTSSHSENSAINNSTSTSEADSLGAFDRLFNNLENDEEDVSLDSFETDSQMLSSPDQLERELAQINTEVNTEFNAPTAMLDATQAPIGLDSTIDAKALISPRNRATLGLEDASVTVSDDSQPQQSNNAPVFDARNSSEDIADTGLSNSSAINESPDNALSAQQTLPASAVDGSQGETSGNLATSNLGNDIANVDGGNTVLSGSDQQPLAHQQNQNQTDQMSNAGSSDETLSASNQPNEIEGGNANDVTDINGTDGLNPDDYLPDYKVDHSNEIDVIEDASESETEQAKTKPGFFKGLYNRLFNGGITGLPKINATILMENENGSDEPVLAEVDDDDQPAKNIKAAMENITVEAITDFNAAIPKLREEAMDAAQAVGYYDIRLGFRRRSNDDVDVIIEHLGDPVIVENRIVDIRGEGAELSEFKEVAESGEPLEGDIFNHGKYKQTKNTINTLEQNLGFFDGQWLNSSVDIILPDNTADMDLIYDTNERYKFDDVVFFTYDREAKKLTTDPEKLPVELELLHQLHDFKTGDNFSQPLITKFTTDLGTTRYFNTVNVEVIKPSDDEDSSTLSFVGADSQERDADSESNISASADITDNTDSLDANDDITNSEMAGNDNGDNLIAQTDAHTDASNDATFNDGDSASTQTQDLNVQSDNATSSDDDTYYDDDMDEAIQPIEYSVDAATIDKLASIQTKAERLSRLPDDRVLEERDEEEAKNILGKISNAISRTVKKILPDDDDDYSDIEDLPDDLSQTVLADRKTPAQVKESKSVPLYVFVTADKPRDVDLGIGYGTDTGVRAVGRLSHNLINRNGYQAGVSVAASKINRTIKLNASRPWKHPLDDILMGNVSYEEEEINQGKGNLDLETNTLQAGIARQIKKESGWDRTYSVRYRMDELESGIEGPDREDLPEPFNREGARFKQEALLLGYKISKTHADNVANPTKGWHQYYSLEAGSEDVVTDTNMAIARAGVSGVYSFGDMDRHQLVGRLEGGYIWADDFESVPYKLRFFAGGDRSLRGYDYNSLSTLENGYLIGGQVLALGSGEYNYEFRPGLRGAVFADVGNAYDTKFETETKLGVGVGVRWASPVGMVRVDLAAGVLEDSIPIRLHFFIGSPLQ